MSFNGFSTPLQSLSTVGPTNGISLTSTTIGDVADISGGLTPANSTNYFLYAYITSQIGSASLVSSPYQYTFTLSDQTTLTSSYNYYYETQPGNVALASGGSFSITGISSTVKVSGISVLINGSMTVSTSLSGITNIGKYYCYHGNIVTYSTTTGTLTPANETNFTNATATAGGNWYLTDANNQKYINSSGITFTRNDLALSIPASTYTASPVSLSATITGIGISIPLTTTATSNVIIDSSSNTLAYSTFKQTLADASLSSTYINGYRVYSVAGDISGVFVINGGASMSTVGYNNNISIAGGLDSNGNNYNSELLLAKGGLITRGYYDSTVFANYSTYSGNSFDYSTIASDTNSRFATFVWNCQRPASGSFSKINLKITFDPTTTFTPSAGGYQVNGSNFILFYRIEDSLTGPNPPATASFITNVSSSWINGNTTTGTPVSSTIYHNTVAKNGSPLVSNSAGIATYKLNLPNTIATAGRAQRLYIRIGAQNNASFKITNIQAFLSAT